MKILCIDGNSLINRAFYGIRILTTKDGRFTNAITGFLNIMLRLVAMVSPDGIAVAWDKKAPTFRHKMFDEYKAGRKSMPPELFEQMEPLKEILTAYGCVCIEKEGFEADDILGTLSALCEKNGDECVIATGDRDSLQLVSDKTRVLLSATKAGKPEIIVYDKNAVFEKYGVTPIELIEIKALQGDSSDNIPGVSGVGEKTAADLISRFHSIDNIYENIDTADIKDSVKAKLIKDKDKAYLSRTLGTIVKDVPIDSTVSNYAFRRRKDEELGRLLKSYELFKITERMGLNGVCAEQSELPNKKFPKFTICEDIPKKSEVCVFFDGENFAFCEDSQITVKSSDRTEEIAKILENDVKKQVYNYKQIYKFCKKNNITPKNVVFDSMLAGYLLNPSSNSYEIERLKSEYSVPDVQIDGENENGVCKLCAENSLICNKLKGLIDAACQTDLLLNIELPLSEVLAEMEIAGFLADKAEIENYGKTLSGEINRLQSEIFLLAGEEFNINSPKQLGVILFEKLSIPSKKKTKNGYSTSADVLDSLKDEYPIVDLILKYRGLSKLKSTYCDGLSAAADENGRIHSTLNQTETRTGRISSTDPNLQNIPVRKPEGRQLRKFFVAKDGYCLVDADYSQIELRVLADISKDTAMTNAFLEDSDIHTITASEVFGVPAEQVTPLMRSHAKAVNFGIVYGIGAFSLAKDIGVTNREASSYIKGYLATYKGVDEYMKQTVEKAKEQGFCETLFHRRRFLPELKSNNHMLRAFGERVARNMPIQGTAADIIKIAMIKVRNRLREELPSAELIMQIHDELIVEAPLESAEIACKIVKEEMENAVKLTVPLKADTSFGKTWFEAKN